MKIITKQDIAERSVYNPVILRFLKYYEEGDVSWDEMTLAMIAALDDAMKGATNIADIAMKIALNNPSFTPTFEQAAIAELWNKHVADTKPATPDGEDGGRDD